MANETSRLKAEIRDADLEELKRLLQQFKVEHFQLRMQAATAALDNPMRLSFVKKAIARVETELHARRTVGVVQ